MLLPSIMPHTEVVNAWIKAPRTNARSARSTTRLRPRDEARRPERGEMRSAKREVQDVMRDLSRVVRGRPRELCRLIRVEDITPVSSDLYMLAYQLQSFWIKPCESRMQGI